MADVQLGQFGDGGDGLDRGVVDAVAGMDLQAQGRGLDRAALLEAQQLAAITLSGGEVVG